MYTLQQLKEKGIVNWIGSWKFNFSVFYNKFITTAPNFLSKKSEKLIADIEDLSVNRCSIFTPEIEKILLDNKITNWIWWEWANIEYYIKFIINKLEKYKIYDINKSEKLYNDIYRLHFLHDILLLVSSSKFDFYIANYIFARDLLKLIKWVWIIPSIAISFSVFMILNKYGKKYSRHTKI